MILLVFISISFKFTISIFYLLSTHFINEKITKRLHFQKLKNKKDNLSFKQKSSAEAMAYNTTF
ncbi:hypothetical protein HMPREF1651_06615 [Prevotella bivia DNF00188]|uniref:Uncharacterized protein n=1 Tax=Prevotella bivia TaxID=28125 RepID=A0A137SY37_9BACT|nr:hypothetical protein HMPREF1651_06615 [Prevotella bivia DNF00188]KXO17297.1 hypothetical protein HMPREF3202_01255 [Prevotella bivia]